MQVRQHCSKRFCFLLALLVLGQEFHHVIIANAFIDIHGNQVPDEKEPDAVTQAYNQIVLHKNTSQADGFDKREIVVEKRIAPLVAVAIGVGLVSLGVDVLLKVKGCCVFYPSICRDVKEFDYRKKVVSKYIKVNNQQWSQVNNIKNWVDLSNRLNSAIWVEILRIEIVEEMIVKHLGPEIIKKFNNERLRLKHEVEAQNETVLAMTYQQISDQLQSPFDNAEDTAMRISGITGMVGVEIASSAFKYFKIKQISNTLRTSYGAKLTKASPAAKKVLGLSRTSTTMHIKQTSKSVFKAKFAGSKYAKFAKGAGRFLSVVSIAWDIYSIIKKIKACKKVRDKSRESARKIREAEGQARQLYVELYKYKNNLLVGGFTFLKGQLVSNDLKTVLTSFIEMARSSPSEAKDLRSTEPVFTKFLREIHGANPQKMHKLQVELLGSLRKITIYYACYLTKVQLVKYVSEHCKRGTSSMQDLYNRGNAAFGSNNQYCTVKNGLPYTMFSDVQAIVKDDANVQGFNADCILNSEAKKKEACSYKHNGFTAQQAAAKMTGVTAAQVEIIYKTCPEKPLTPNDKKTICMLRTVNKKSDDFIANLLGLKVERVKAVKC